MLAACNTVQGAVHLLHMQLEQLGQRVLLDLRGAPCRPGPAAALNALPPPFSLFLASAQGLLNNTSVSIG